jgi:type II secretory pathway component GspD/PulD (secretin)
LPIPEGVSTEVATIFQQLNAAASGPLLTIAIDPTSNSLVLRGPGELTDEVTEFINKLEKQYEDAPAQRIQVLRLESTNSANLERALRLLYTK